MTDPLPPYADGRAEPGWLAARRRADVRARAAARELVRRLEQHLAPGPVHGLDIGTGTGANHTYLTSQFTVETTWSVLDHDPDLLAHPTHSGAVHRLTDLTELPEMLNRQNSPTFLTCSAVLDVLRDRDIEALTRVIADRRLPALFSLSVTGDVVIQPKDPLDDCITAAFNAHQRRDGRLGPDAPRSLAARLPAAWLLKAATPWQLHANADGELLSAYLTERADVAIDQDRNLAAAAANWLERRLGQLEEGHLTVEVGHVDQLVVPT